MANGFMGGLLRRNKQEQMPQTQNTIPPEGDPLPGQNGQTGIPIQTGLPAKDALSVLQQPIGSEQVRKAHQTMLDYKRGKKSLEQRVIDNEQWYRLRQWEFLRKQNKDENQVEPVSAWLFNSLQNKHADAMDNFPSPNFLPREETDVDEAQKLSSIVPVILDQNGFEEIYSEHTDDKLHSGTGVYGIFWDKDKLNGLGDIAIRNVDLLSIFWEPGKQKIQDSRNVFTVELRDNDLLIEEYPQLDGKLGGNTGEMAEYVFDDSIDTSGKSAVIDWYYKKKQNGRTVLHYVKFVGDTVLFATENEKDYAQTGWYQHGMYPFVFDTLFRVKGSPCGFGYIDVAKSVQEYIDRSDQAILENLLANATPRHMISKASSVNEEEFLDVRKPIVHVEGLITDEQIKPLTVNTLTGIYENVLAGKVNELKEVTGNRDISTGGTTAGVTAASAIAAMQEAGSKLSRDSNKASYRAYREMILMVVELIRQFYDLPRQFRIIGQNGMNEFVSFDNSGIQMQKQPDVAGQDMGYRMPLFDIEVSVQKASPYSKLAQNELALQFYSQGFFDPQRSDQALATIEMMDFDRKESIMRRIAQNGTMYQQLQQMQQQLMMLGTMVDRMTGSNEVTRNLVQQFGMQMPGISGDPGMPPSEVDSAALGGESSGEPAIVKNARQRTADATAPK